MKKVIKQLQKRCEEKGHKNYKGISALYYIDPTNGMVKCRQCEKVLALSPKKNVGGDS